VLAFGEDYAHEVILRTLMERMAAEEQIQVVIQIRSATGGHGRMLRELKQFLGELQRGRTALPDLFVVGRDANCRGYADCVKEIKGVVAGYEGLVALAVP